MSNFYLPYNFIPVTGVINKDRVRTQYKNGDTVQEVFSAARHDVWETGRYSGQLNCCLEIVTPTVVGNSHGVGKDPVTVEQYCWNGKPAIPANSLRGMISSLTEILSQSSLRVLNNQYWPAFENIDPDLVPWNKKRVNLTPAELLFGVVENNKSAENIGDMEDSGDNGQRDTRNLASRVRFTDALLPSSSAGIPGTEIVLKELASPKPTGFKDDAGKFKMARPSLYFHMEKESHEAINYDVLRKILDARDKKTKQPYPHGRKFYLIRKNGAEIICSDVDQNDTKNRMKCALTAPETKFYFTVGFDNLTAAELTLLHKALTPHSGFKHRLGLGKPLGMGIVKISSSLELSDKRTRYSKKAVSSGSGVKNRMKWADFPEENTLIDKNSLELLLRAGMVSGLNPAIDEVRWRDGRKDDEPAVPLPRLRVQNTRLPFMHEDLGDFPEETDSFLNVDNERLTQSQQWLKQTIGKLSNCSIGTMTESQVADCLVTKGVQKQWEKIKDDGLKFEVLKTILANAVTNERPKPWNSGGAIRAKKRYDAWSAKNCVARGEEKND